MFYSQKRINQNNLGCVFQSGKKRKLALTPRLGKFLGVHEISLVSIKLKKIFPQ